MERLVKRRNVQRSLDTAAKEMGGRIMTMGELEKLFHEEGIVTDSLPGRRIAADNVTRYVLLTGKLSCAFSLLFCLRLENDSTYVAWIVYLVRQNYGFY